MAILTGNARVEAGKVTLRRSYNAPETGGQQVLISTFLNNVFGQGEYFYRIRSIEFQPETFNNSGASINVFGRNYEVRSINSNSRNIV